MIPNDDPVNNIIKTIQGMARKYSEFEIFIDWVEIMAISIQNSCHIIHDDVWEKRERRFIEINQKYTAEEQQNFPKLTYNLVMAYEKRKKDILGEVFMIGGFGSSIKGQYFSPFEVSLINAEIAMHDQMNRAIINLYDSCCGSGSMFIAAANILEEQGKNYSKLLKVVAQDLDWKAVYMCYVQLSFLGIDAIVIQGDSIEHSDITKISKENILRTPKRMGMLM